MKKLIAVANSMLLVILSFAQGTADSASNSVDNTTSGYSRAGTIGLIILLLGVVGAVIAFTWRKKDK
jgi:hypothetical protein